MLRFASRRLLSAASRDVRSPAALVLPRFYHERVVDHFNNPRNVGSFDKNDPSVGTGLVGAPACGDVMKLQIWADKVTGKIIRAVFKTFVTEWLEGKTLDEVLTIKNTEIVKHLSLPPVKLHCSMLAEDAVKAAVRDYRGKKDSSSQPEENGAEAKQNSSSQPEDKSAEA